MAPAVTSIDSRPSPASCRPPASLTRRAVERRVAHRLQAEGLALRKCSPRSRWHWRLGDYYTVDLVINGVQDTHQDLADLARELGVISEGQQIAGE